MQQQPLIFGEVLFDSFPDGSRVLGGAPFNVAWNLHGLGQRPLLVSRVGDDPLGHEIRGAMEQWGMGYAGLQLDSAHPTGTVQVSIHDGEPAFEIVADRAYDHIEADQLPPVQPVLLYHGSLATRGPDSAATLQALIRQHPVPRFVDINLRAPWWRREGVLGMLDGAQWVKLNEHEVVELGGQGGDPIELARGLMERHRIGGVILTLGGEGAVVLHGDGPPLRVAPERATEVVDTVGAGDAFASVCICGLLSGWPLETTLQRAQSFASAVVGLRGATSRDPAFYRRFREAWGLAG